MAPTPSFSTLLQALQEEGSSEGIAPALIQCGADGGAVSRATLHLAISDMAGRLREAGVKPGDTVSLAFENSVSMRLIARTHTHTHTHTHTQTHTHTNTHTRTQTHTHAHTQAHTHTSTHTHTQTRTHTETHNLTHTHAHTYTNTCAHTPTNTYNTHTHVNHAHIHVHINTHTHTHIHTHMHTHSPAWHAHVATHDIVSAIFAPDHLLKHHHHPHKP